MKEALNEELWANVMHEEHIQSKINDVWELVPKPNDGNINDTKWIYKNKTDENGYVYRNKSCIVAQGYT